MYDYRLLPQGVPLADWLRYNNDLDAKIMLSCLLGGAMTINT